MVWLYSVGIFTLRVRIKNGRMPAEVVAVVEVVIWLYRYFQ